MPRCATAIRLMLITLVTVLASGCSDDMGRTEDGGVTLASVTASVPSTEELSDSGFLSNDLSPTTPSLEPTMAIGTPRGGEIVTADDRPASAAPTEVSLSRESSFDRDGDGYYTYEELEEAVTALMPNYDFPPSYQVTPDIMMMSMKPFASSGARWRVPMEYTVVNIYHQCAWELTWLDAYRDGNTELMEESLHQLQNVALAGPTIEASLRDWMVEMYDRAALGDPTLIQQDVDSSCQMEWATPQPGTPQATVGRADRLFYDLGAGLKSITA